MKRQLKSTKKDLALLHDDLVGKLTVVSFRNGKRVMTCSNGSVSSVLREICGMAKRNNCYITVCLPYNLSMIEDQKEFEEKAKDYFLDLGY